MTQPRSGMRVFFAHVRVPFFSPYDAVKSIKVRRAPPVKETDSITIESDNAFAVEFDGEVICTKRVTYSVLPVKIKICA